MSAWIGTVVFLCAAVAQRTLGTALAGPPLARFSGGDFNGGARAVYGGSFDGESVNYVYSQATGELASMRATFTLPRPPGGPYVLHLRARDDDAPAECAVEISVNGAPVFTGASGFPSHAWDVHHYPLPPGTLRRGENELVIVNREASGRAGMPPWFMVAGAAIADEGYAWAPDITRDFSVTLPAKARPIPEPLPEGVKPGFPLRGTKGWMWTPEQYLEEIPYLSEFKMNFLMLCYGSMCDVENIPWGDDRCNRWWEDLPAPKKAKLESVVKECQKRDITFCFSMNPGLCTRRPLKYGSDQDFELLWKHYAWMQGLGVTWFNISLDDIDQGIDAAGQARLVNTMLARLRVKDPAATLIFTPTRYWGDGTDAESRPYLETLARKLDKDVRLFWTGDQVVGPVTRRSAESYKSISGHRLFLWDNYPVNDDHPTMHLGPVVGRDADLCGVVEGYMCNPMRKQNRLNRLPLLTCADYAYNPAAYDPARSIGQAILHLADTDQRRGVLKDLVEAYPGMLLFKAGTDYNPVRAQYTRLAGTPHSRYIVEMYATHIETLSARMGRALGDRFSAEKRILDQDVAWMRHSMKSRYGPRP